VLALHDDLQKIFAPVKAELKKLALTDSPTLPGLEISISQHPVGSHRVDEILSDVRTATQEGAPADKAIYDALASQIEDILASRLRSIFENLAPEISPSEFKEIKSEIERAVTSIDTGSEARSFLDSGRAATPVHDDEDLRGPDVTK
jgi:hypothetical protein